jgi:succinate dehydrogenase / fumarate reductase, cytochrome b subunit
MGADPRCALGRTFRMTRRQPLSPHLSIYRPMHTMILSILHRGTGLALSVGALLFVWWLLALAAGPGPYGRLLALMRSPFGVLVRVGLLVAFWYHFAAGIRHLVFDTGRALEKHEARRAGQMVVVAAVLLSLASLATLWWAGAGQ